MNKKLWLCLLCGLLAALLVVAPLTGAFAADETAQEEPVKDENTDNGSDAPASAPAAPATATTEAAQETAPAGDAAETAKEAAPADEPAEPSAPAEEAVEPAAETQEDVAPAEEAAEPAAEAQEETVPEAEAETVEAALETVEAAPEAEPVEAVEAAVIEDVPEKTEAAEEVVEETVEAAAEAEASLSDDWNCDEQGHVYDSGKTVRELNFEDYENEDEDGHIHVRSYDLYEVCDVCGEREYFDWEEERSSLEPHKMSDGKCTVCGWECGHYDHWVNGKCSFCGVTCKHDGSTYIYFNINTKVGTKAVEIPGHDGAHNSIGEYIVEHRCSICGVTLDTKKLGESEGYNPHEYNEDGVCVSCGHKCSHSDSYTDEYEDWDSEPTYTYKNKYAHTVTRNLIEDTRCTNCWKVLSTTISGTRDFVEQHDYASRDDDDGNEYWICEECGDVTTTNPYPISCPHEHTEEDTWEENYTYKDTGSDKVHEATYTEYTETHCLDCLFR